VTSCWIPSRIFGFGRIRKDRAMAQTPRTRSRRRPWNDADDASHRYNENREPERPAIRVHASWRCLPRYDSVRWLGVFASATSISFFRRGMPAVERVLERLAGLQLPAEGRGKMVPPPRSPQPASRLAPVGTHM
jgi:hypothetical protein